MQFQQVNAINSSPATASKIARENASLSAGFAYKAQETPKGAVMFAYTVALLGMLGALTIGRKGFDRKALTGMFGSETVFTHHKKAGNIEVTGKGMARLTAKGLAHFSGRETGKVLGQSIRREDVSAMAVAVKTGKVTPNTSAAMIQWRETGQVK